MESIDKSSERRWPVPDKISSDKKNLLQQLVACAKNILHKQMDRSSFLKKTTHIEERIEACKNFFDVTIVKDQEQLTSLDLKRFKEYQKLMGDIVAFTNGKYFDFLHNPVHNIYIHRMPTRNSQVKAFVTVNTGRRFDLVAGQNYTYIDLVNGPNNTYIENEWRVETTTQPIIACSMPSIYFDCFIKNETCIQHYQQFQSDITNLKAKITGFTVKFAEAIKTYDKISSLKDFCVNLYTEIDKKIAEPIGSLSLLSHYSEETIAKFKAFASTIGLQPDLRHDARVKIQHSDSCPENATKKIKNHTMDDSGFEEAPAVVVAAHVPETLNESAIVTEAAALKSKSASTTANTDKKASKKASEYCAICSEKITYKFFVLEASLIGSSVCCACYYEAISVNKIDQLVAEIDEGDAIMYTDKSGLLKTLNIYIYIRLLQEKKLFLVGFFNCVKGATIQNNMSPSITEFIRNVKMKLEEKGRRTQLLVIDGAPENVQIDIEGLKTVRCIEGYLKTMFHHPLSNPKNPELSNIIYENQIFYLNATQIAKLKKNVKPGFGAL